MGKSTLGLSDIIDKIKNEFVQMEKKSDPKGKFQFDFRNIEVEIAFVVSKKGKAGVNLVVAQVGGEYEKEQVHKIKFKIKPHKLDYEKDENKTKWKKQGKYEKWLEDNKYPQPTKKTFSTKKAQKRTISVRRKARYSKRRSGRGRR